jgi:hypothetical protein
MTDLPEELTPPKRPILVWIISIFFFICTPFVLFSLVMTLLMVSGAIPVPESQRQFFESQSNFDHGATIINDIMVPIWAVLFFLLKRESLYVFLGMLALSVITITYAAVAEGMFSGLGALGLILIAIIFILNLATFYYNWHLFRKGVLR